MKVLITGGAGFIGINTAKYYLDKGDEVVLFDSLSRPGASVNLAWLQEQFPAVTFIEGDIRSETACNELFKENRDTDFILHLAGQVAVTTSVLNPREDFEANAAGTLNVLEAFRYYCPEAFFLYASTNKVYGKLTNFEIEEENERYSFKEKEAGVSETQPLDFYSPYGCSKGAADQYVHDYARIYNLKTTVFRQSCVYGYRQFGIEDQGWVAWFTIANVLNENITIYGNGKQVRDVLFIDDLLRAFDLAYQHQEKTSGKVYNIGGGSQNTLSLLELLKLLETNEKNLSYSEARPGDQEIYVSDIKRAATDFDWAPEVSPNEGVERLKKWVLENKEMLQTQLGRFAL